MDDKLRLEVKEIVNKTVMAKIMLVCVVVGPIFGAGAGICGYAYASDKEYSAKYDQAQLKATEALDSKMDLVIKGVDKIQYIEKDVATLTNRVERLERNQTKNIAEDN